MPDSSSRGHRCLDGPAGLGEALAGEALGVLEVPVPIARAIVGRVGRLELGDDADEALRDRVVDLAGHPGALVEDAGLAGLGQELGMQTGVLDQGGLELGERLPALLVLLGHLLSDDRARADDERLDGDDRDVERPPLGGLREAGDQGVDEERGGEHAHERERQRPQDRGVEEAADQEDEEERRAEHEDRREDQQPDEEDAHAKPMRMPRWRQAGEHQVDPRRGCRREREGPGLPRQVSRAGGDDEDGRRHEQGVPAPADHRVAEALPAGLHRRRR